MVQVKPSIRTCISRLWLSWMVIFQALVGCHDILILDRSPIKWRQRPDKTLAVDWDVKYQFKQTNKQTNKIKPKYDFSIFLTHHYPAGT